MPCNPSITSITNRILVSNYEDTLTIIGLNHNDCCGHEQKNGQELHAGWLWSVVTCTVFVCFASIFRELKNDLCYVRP